MPMSYNDPSFGFTVNMASLAQIFYKNGHKYSISVSFCEINDHSHNGLCQYDIFRYFFTDNVSYANTANTVMSKTYLVKITFQVI